MFEPQITELFIVEDEAGHTQGIMEVTMSDHSSPASMQPAQSVSYWLADGTLVEAIAGASRFVDRNTDAEFRRVSSHEAGMPYAVYGDSAPSQHQLS